MSTIWTGPVVQNNGVYEHYIISLWNASGEFPAPTPEVQAVHATFKFIDCNTLELDYDFFGAYLWTSNKTPFVDDPDYVPVPPPFTEVYHRVQAGSCPQCQKASSAWAPFAGRRPYLGKPMR